MLRDRRLSDIGLKIIADAHRHQQMQSGRDASEVAANDVAAHMDARGGIRPLADVRESQREGDARLEIQEQVPGTFLEDAEIVGVSATENLGIDDLRAAIEALLAGAPISPEQIPSIGCNIKWHPEDA